MRAYLVMLAGGLMLLSSLAHGLIGWPAMQSALDAAGAGDELAGALSAGWYWGTASMIAFGSITLVTGLRLQRGDRSGVTMTAVIAICYLLFGGFAFVTHHYNPHFLVFVGTGLLAGCPLFGGTVRAGDKASEVGPSGE